ncbi:MAG: SRPBCC domain-containing protein [Chloroflexi bacterium]|uniref:SRPBCC domain-containing protein n=1 Tax=Candidatus Chlorohelix allophototropha TaxID=3003348 RepID=A0A8T7MAB1_9CHLR|nr:SRPBCC domain-containing protein [Chloroflexota bacterium]WJW68864.1 SRPBCC domain-containing protein [Chloroflexota bacterium L227-S17]
MNLEAFTVEREIWIDARPETIFPFFTDPVKLTKWKGVKATLDPQPGGIYRTNITGRDIVSGKYVEVSPYNRVVFTWGWEGEGSPLPPGTSTVEINLVPDGQGTRLHLKHSNLPTPEMLKSHTEGWEHFLPRLVEASLGNDPGPDPWASGNNQ